MYTYDVRHYDGLTCDAAIESYENEIALGRGDTEMYRRALVTLKARLAELNGESVSWSA